MKKCRNFQFQITQDLKVSDSASKFELMPFDNIYIHQSPGYGTKMVQLKEKYYFPDFTVFHQSERFPI